MTYRVDKIAVSPAILGVRGGIFCILIGYMSIVFAHAQETELESIQSQIKQTQVQLSKNLASSERLQQELKLAELEIAQTATRLNKTDSGLVKTQTEKTKLEKRRGELRTSIANQQGLLANQLKSAYMAGNYDFAKMFFNQDDAGRFERVLTYYQYLNKARQSQIQEFTGLITALEIVEKELIEKEQALSKLLVTQQQQSEQLRQQQQSRHKKLQQLDQQIQSDTARVNALQQEERSLLSAIESAEIAARERAERQEQADVEVNLDGLQALKGKLSRPTTGSMRSLFGKRRQGQVVWKGVIFNSKEGIPVKAVHDGKVLYADWLKGFGLVVVVDHGKGFMSVYGRNQALLKEPGHAVLAGETIGLVGSSGGQSSAGLYFELRHKGKALNPETWLSK